MTVLRQHRWAMEFVDYLIESGCDISTIVNQSDESYIHLYVRMIMNTGKTHTISSWMNTGLL